MTVWRGMSGTHWGVFIPGAVLLIERRIATDTLNRLAECESVEALLDTLVRDGFETLPGLGLVAVSGQRVTAYLRGGFSLRVEASWHEAMTASGAGVKSWKEVSYDGVARFGIFGPADRERCEVPLRSHAAELSVIVPGVQGLCCITGDELTEGELSLITEQPRPASPSVESTTTHQDSLEVFPDTVFADLLEDTSDTTAIEFLNTSDLPTEAVTPGALILPDGGSVPVNGVLLLGRNPKAAAGATDTPIAVYDPNGSISRTHARVFLRDTEVMLEDLDSTNGTVIVSEQGEQLLRAHTPASLRDGDQILLGGEVRLLYKKTVSAGE